MVLHPTVARFLKSHAAILFAVGWLLLYCSRGLAEDHAPARQLWLYYPTNLLVDSNVDKLRPSFAGRRRPAIRTC